MRANSAVSRDLPTPAAPRTVKRWQARSERTRSQASSSARRSRSRPTIGTSRPARDRIAGRTSESRYAATGSDFPFSLERPAPLQLDRVAHQLNVLGADQHLARLGRLFEPCGDVDRIAGAERARRVPVTTSPVLTPMRAADPELGRRRASRPPPAGAQRVVLVHDRDAEDAITASPMNFSTRAAVTLDRSPFRSK